MENVKQQISEIYESPSLISNLMMNAGIDMEYATSAIKSRQTVHLDEEDFNKLLWSENVLFYESDKDEVENLDSIDLDDSIDLSNLDDGITVSEYVGGYEKYLLHPYYIKYAKENNQDILVSIYEAEALLNISRRPDVIRDKVDLHSVLSVDKQIVLKQYPFNITKSLHYTSFGTTKYESGLLVPLLQDPIHILSIDIPYNYYRYQPLHPGVYNWDMDKNTHMFGDMKPEEFETLFNDIVKNGIREPLFMRMDGETLSAPDIKTNVILFIAKLLKIPSIPVNVYLSNEDITCNRLIDAIVAEDVSLQNVICKSTEYMTNIFDPYFILYKEEDPNTPIVKANDKEYNVAFYKIFKDIGHMKVRYLDKSVSENVIEDNEKMIRDHQEYLKNLEEEKINNEVQEMINKLRSGSEEI